MFLLLLLRTVVPGIFKSFSTASMETLTNNFPESRWSSQAQRLLVQRIQKTAIVQS
jgi:hypothetical protein